jgi:lipid-binding SYLF domain-containing protein
MRWNRRLRCRLLQPAKPLFWLVLLLMCARAVDADTYSDTTALFKNAGQSAAFFDDCYGFAVFPTIGKGGLGVGAAHGKGRVYESGSHVGDASMTQASFGLQAGGKAYSEMIFFQDKRAFDEFISGSFAFGADATAVAVKAAAGANAGTKGTSAGASLTKKDAATSGRYYKGMAVFTIVKGGLMYQAAAVIRKLRIDELPGVFNVLRGRIRL